MEETTNKRFYAKVVEIPQPPCEMWDCPLQDRCRTTRQACDAFRYYVFTEESKYKKNLTLALSKVCANLRPLT